MHVSPVSVVGFHTESSLEGMRVQFHIHKLFEIPFLKAVY